jgi:hypothetical protein
MLVGRRRGNSGVAGVLRVFGQQTGATGIPLTLQRRSVSVLYKDSAYRAVNTLHFGYKNQSLNNL